MMGSPVHGGVLYCVLCIASHAISRLTEVIHYDVSRPFVLRYTYLASLKVTSCKCLKIYAHSWNAVYILCLLVTVS